MAIRYRVGLTVRDIYPLRTDGLCRCGCGRPSRVSWASDECMHAAVSRFRILKGDMAEVREALRKRDGGRCARCGATDKPWEAHHKVPVCRGGLGCEVDGYETLCVDCHKDETRKLFSGAAA